MLYYMQYAAAGVESNVPTGVLPSGSPPLTHPAAAYSSLSISDPAGLKAYFVGAFQALPKLTVKFGEQFVRVYGDTAVNTGYYTLFYTKDGETKSIPARYSFTYVKEGNDCKIVDHHSSAMPAPTR